MPSTNNVIQIVINGKNNVTKVFNRVAKSALVMGTAVAGAFAAAGFKAAKFEKNLAEISTLLDGDVGPAIEQVKEELLGMSVAMGQSLGSLSKAKYDIISAGFTGVAESALVLESASKLALAGVSDVASTADLLTTALNGMGKSGKDAARVSDVLFQIVRKGKTTMDDLGTSLGKIFATAKTANIGIEELGAVVATMTAKGVATAETVTSMNSAILAIAAPAKEAKEALSETGITLDNGLIPALAALGNLSDSNLGKLREFIPSIEALKTAAVAASDIKMLNENLLAMGDATGVVDDGVAKMSETFDFQFNQMKQALNALVIEVGTQVLPHMTSLVGMVRDGAVTLRFLSFETDEAAAAARGLANVIKNELQLALTNINSALGGMASEVLTPVEWSLKKLSGMMNWFGESNRGANNPLAQWAKQAGHNLEWMAYAVDHMDAGGLVDLDAALESLQNNMLGASDRIRGEVTDVLEPFFAALRAAKEEAEAFAEAEKEAREDASAFNDALGAMNNHLFQVKEVLEETGNVLTEAEEDWKEYVEKLTEHLADLAQFTIEDFMNMAFAIGDSFAMVASDVMAQMLGLAEGPMVVGRAFKRMAVGILTDLTRIIARMAVAKALMSALGLGGGSGFFGGALKALGGFAHGGRVMHAAHGLSIPGGNLSSMGAAMILPGSPGLDATPVLARGGELFVSPERQKAAVQTLLSRPVTQPRRTRTRTRGRKVELVQQVSRPFRTEEQVDLAASVNDGLDRAERHEV